MSGSGKKVTFGAKPAPRPVEDVADSWVETRQADDPPIVEEPNKRLTLDLPESLHRRIKATCASRGVKMVDAIRELLEAQFPAQ